MEVSFSPRKKKKEVKPPLRTRLRLRARALPGGRSRVSPGEGGNQRGARGSQRDHAGSRRALYRLGGLQSALLRKVLGHYEDVAKLSPMHWFGGDVRQLKKKSMSSKTYTKKLKINQNFF